MTKMATALDYQDVLILRQVILDIVFGCGGTMLTVESCGVNFLPR